MHVDGTNVPRKKLRHGVFGYCLHAPLSRKRKVCPHYLSQTSAQRESVYPKFTDESLCPVTCLTTYLDRTKDWRQTNDKPRLFLSFKKPHKPVASSTVSRWIKEIIVKSGIKDGIFKGHSVRSASTSAAKASGLSIDTIISMADWTSASTFNKFYYKPSLPITYGTAVLSNLS